MKKFIKYFIPLLVVGILIWIDQYTKYLVDSNMALNEGIPVIEGVFEIRYIQNPGTAWGMLAGQQTFFLIMTTILLITMSVFYVLFSRHKKYHPLNYVMVILFAGAIGNMIDRIRFQYVIDFLYFKLIDFPVFNVADMYVVISMIALSLLVFFKYTEEDFVLKNIISGTIPKQAKLYMDDDGNAIITDEIIDETEQEEFDE